MNLQFVKSIIRKSRYENEANPAQLRGMKLPINVNLELVYPNVVKEGSVFLLVDRTSIGNPVQKFSLYVELVCTFKIVDLEEGFDTSRANMQKFISMICHPIVLKEMQRAVDSLTGLYELQPIKLPTSLERSSEPKQVIDLSGKGLPN